MKLMTIHTLLIPDLAYAWASLLLLDTSCFVMTLAKTLQVKREWQGELYGIILRDGTYRNSISVTARLDNYI